VPPELRTRFLRLVVNKAQRTPLANYDEVQGAYTLLNSVVSDLQATAPELLPMANSLLVSMQGRLAGRLAASRERDQRIHDSYDTVGAYVSEAEKENDRGEKFHHYMMIPSLQDYVLVSQDEAKIEVFRRPERGRWEHGVARAGETLAIAGRTIRVDDVYRRAG